MATDTQIRVRPARYGGFEATFTYEGELYRVFFTSAFDLAHELAGECIDGQTIESVIDCFEQLEWSDTEYPFFQPAEACCDFEPPPYDPNAWAFHVPDHSRFWDAAAASLRIGVVASPWLLLLVAAKWAGVL